MRAVRFRRRRMYRICALEGRPVCLQSREKNILDSRMALSPGAISLVKSPWADTFHRLLSEARENLLLASPFVKRSQASKILSCLQSRGVHNDIHVALITDVRPESVFNGASDL